MLKRRLLFLLLYLLLVAVSPLGTWAGDGSVALQSAEPSCRTTYTPPPRYVDCDNGTVTDNKTGLVWLKDANCFGATDWYTAMEVVAGLADVPGFDDEDCGLDDGSSPGEWRLPSISEWKQMTEDAAAKGCTSPALTTASGLSCIEPIPCLLNPASCPFSNVPVEDVKYWSATSSPSNLSFARTLSIATGGYGTGLGKITPHYVWPVRHGQ